MKLHFNPSLEFQQQAIQSITDLFVGHMKQEAKIEALQSYEYFGNELLITDNIAKENLQSVQKNNGIELEEEPDLRNFSIEMETGTGKTYVYLRTLFELNQKYGWTKFIIVVPSLAIRAGVLKSLEMTQDHFKNLYSGVRYNYYDYDSSRLNKMNDFRENTEMQIMVITYQAFNSQDNVIHLTEKNKEGFGEKSLMQRIAQTSPILILDEPQSIEGKKTKEMMKLFNPLFTLRYSATHKHEYSMTYKLSPVDAYRKGLVKGVRVVGIQEGTDSNLPQLECLSIDPGTKITATFRIVDGSGNAKNITCKQYDDLAKKSKNPIYQGYIIETMSRSQGKVTFLNGQSIDVGESYQQDTSEVMKAQIRETILAHFARREFLRNEGIKPLCLFFIDKVAHFVGDTERIQSYFIEQMKTLEWKEEQIKKSYAYYFASKKDKKTGEIKEWKDALGNNQTDREIEKEMYQLIMTEKEQLLGLDNDVEFIFSHSALKEGWDNPNIFTICTLKTTHSETRKRQEIGRGMRLPVKAINNEFIRVHDREINKLTVVPNESYASFVKGYQKDLENEGYSSSEAKEASENLENAKTTKQIQLNKNMKESPQFLSFWKAINSKTYYTLENIDNTDIITSCTQHINENLEEYSISRVRITRTEAEIIAKSNGEEGFEAIETDGESTIANLSGNRKYMIPGILTMYQRKTDLSKQVLAKIRQGIEKKHLFTRNPAQFIELTSKYINESLQRIKTNGAVYFLSDETYKIDLDEVITIDTENNSMIVETIQKKPNGGTISKSFYDIIKVDSTKEKIFAENFAKDSNILFFFKLPDSGYNRFSIRTPAGSYSPDRGIVIKKQDLNHEIHFIVETKGTTDFNQLKGVEQNKIICAKKHFQTLKSNVKYEYLHTYEKFKAFYMQIAE